MVDEASCAAAIDDEPRSTIVCGTESRVAAVIDADSCVAAVIAVIEADSCRGAEAIVLESRCGASGLSGAVPTVVGETETASERLD